MRCSGLVVFAGLLALGVWGCSDAEREVDVLAAAKLKSLVPVDYHLGIVSSDVVYECLIGGTQSKTVAQVQSSCGCAGANLKAGDVLNFSKPFKVSVSMKGKPTGKGFQTVVIRFQDDTAFAARVHYEYRPIPYVAPEYLVFKAGEDTKTITLTFPGEQAVKLGAVDAPANLQWSMTRQAASDGSSLVLEFKVNRADPQLENEGVIEISSSSLRRSEFKLPFLILYKS